MRGADCGCFPRETKVVESSANDKLKVFRSALECLSPATTGQRPPRLKFLDSGHSGQSGTSWGVPIQETTVSSAAQCSSTLCSRAASASVSFQPDRRDAMCDGAGLRTKGRYRLALGANRTGLFRAYPRWRSKRAYRGKQYEFRLLLQWPIWASGPECSSDSIECDHPARALLPDRQKSRRTSTPTRGVRCRE